LYNLKETIISKVVEEVKKGGKEGMLVPNPLKRKLKALRVRACHVIVGV
jgi:hypothetical protein